MSRPLVLAGSVVAWLLLACGSSGGSGNATSTGSGGAGGGCVYGPLVGDLPCKVGSVLHDKCQTCHQIPQQNGAHFPLLTYEDTQQPFGPRRRWQRMAEVIEPGAVPHMPYKMAPQLTPAELQTLQSWFAACAPPEAEGKGCDQGEPP